MMGDQLISLLGLSAAILFVMLAVRQARREGRRLDRDIHAQHS
jgi:hypothetical protein